MYCIIPCLSGEENGPVVLVVPWPIVRKDRLKTVE